LTIDPNGVNPQVGDLPLDPSTFQTVWAPGTSFAISNCLVHTGELLASGQPACKLYTLQCTIGTGNTASGAQCPVSTLANEVLQDAFDGPAFTLTDIATPGGPTFHEGIGLLMASEGWTGGPCTFDTASGLQDLTCPQNLLTTFSGPGTYISSGQTTHPNSTFISVAQVPEDLTTVTVAGMHAGNWINSTTANVTLSSQPPNLAGTALPGVANFVPSPIQNITYGISPAGSVPAPGAPIATDVTLQNSQGCPTPASPGSPSAALFTPSVQTLSGLEDGYYLLHYYAQDCAGTEELKFAQDNTGSWSTNFYTFAINVDTVPPVVASGPTLSPGPSALGTYQVGELVTAAYSCTDALSGVIRCGSQTFAAGTTNTGPLTTTVDTSSQGTKNFTVVAFDAAGNQSSQSVTYQVGPAYDSHIKLTLFPSTVTYPLGTNLEVHVASINGRVPTGTISILDGGHLLVTLHLRDRGVGFDYLRDLAAGMHYLTAVYSGDRYNSAGNSAPVTLNVLPAPVTVRMTPSAWYLTGGNLTLTASVQSWRAGPPDATGQVTFTNGNTVLSVVPVNAAGNASYTIAASALQNGRQSFTATYSGGTNYATGSTSITVQVAH
jgi:hypothetical protein